MLYITTRDDQNTLTAHRALTDALSADGGLYLPYRFPVLSQDDLDAILSKPFNQCTAEVLNLLFGSALSGWDLEFSIGRRPVRFQSLGHRIQVAEAWHNPSWNYDHLVKTIANLLGYGESLEPGGWVQIGIRIAVLFGIFAEIKQQGFDKKMDISLLSGEFSGPISAWYAQHWGLPIGNIVCCCNENSGIWDLICHGQMRTDNISISTPLTEADVTIPRDLERLIYSVGGTQEVARYLDFCRTGKPYSVDETILAKLRQGLFVSVVSSSRFMDTIPSVYRTHGYLLSPYGALIYAGLLDYRARTGTTRPCVILSERGPACDLKLISQAMGMPEKLLQNYI